MSKNNIIEDYYVKPANVPVIDFQLLNAPDDAKRQAAAGLLDAALREGGFVYICNHNISPERIDQAFEWSRRFFAQPSEAKELIAHPPSGEVDEDRGWAKTELGHTLQMVFDTDEAEDVRQKNPDFKETLELGNPFSDEVPPNKWLPEHIFPGFRAFTESWWTDCATLAHSLYRSLGEALRVQDDYFARIHSKNDCHMTWNFYPSMPLQELHSADAKRLNAHTDFGTLTLVFQDAVGGLEVYDGHTFRPIVPVPGAIVVNVGDMLEKLSNGRWKSALHRVVAPAQLMKAGSVQVQSGHSSVANRYSLVFFGVPNPDEMIETAPGCEEPGKWSPNMSGPWGTLSAREWIQKRLAVEY